MTYTLQLLETGARALQRLHALDIPLDRARTERELRRAGCAARLVGDTLGMLQEAGLLMQAAGGTYLLTQDGRECALGLTRKDWTPFVHGLLTLPSMRVQLELGLDAVVDHDGRTAIDRTRLPPNARDLAAVLSWATAVPDAPHLVPLADDWLETLQLSPAASPRDWVTQNEVVGDRAERYSLLLLRSTFRPGQVGWVAAESDRYGFDIEVRRDDTELAIEVKGSTSRNTQFYLSRRERGVAAERRRNYFIHFWGDIDLAASPLADYRRLRVLGYPLVFEDPEALIAAGRLGIEATSWVVSANRSSP